MPISLRLPEDLETQIAGFGERQGISKSAVLVRSIQEFLARHAQPTSLQIYEEAMREAGGQPDDARRQALEQRPLELAVRKAIRRKHAKRSKLAKPVLTTPHDRARKQA